MTTRIGSALPLPRSLASPVLLAPLLLLPLLGACGGDNGVGAADPNLEATSLSATPTPSPTESPTPSTPAPTEPPRLIAYAGGESPGVEVLSRTDAKKLRGAPQDFKDFISDLAQRNADASTCTGGFVGVTVQRLRTDGFAVGGVNDCGGYAALWAVVDGSCYDYDTQEQLTYEHS